MRASTLEKSKFDMLKPKALEFDLEPGGDYMRAGNTPPARAFQLLCCGCDLLLTLADEAFPALDRKTQKRGAKWIRQAMLFYGDRGTVLLAHAAPALMARTGGRLDGDEPPEVSGDHHQRLFETVKSFYPLTRTRAGAIEGCLAEFTVMETHEPRPAVVEGTHPPNEYSQALLRGENPDEDPRLVELQREYARDYFLDRATYLAIRWTLDPNDTKIVGEKLLRFPLMDDEAEASALRARLLPAWKEGLRSYMEYARLDSQQA